MGTHDEVNKKTKVVLSRIWIHKQVVNQDLVLPPSGPLCRCKALHRDVKHSTLMGRRVVKIEKKMVRMILLTLQTPGVVCTSNL